MANDPDKVARFVAMFAAHPPQALVADFHGDVGAMTLGGQVFPYTLTDKNSATNCYLCSPTVAYIDYAYAENRTLDAPRIVKRLASGAIGALAPLVRAAGLDHQAQLNNWMISTNPVPALTHEVVADLKSSCLSRYPDRAIVVRSLNDYSDLDSMAVLKDAGFKRLASRQVYMTTKGPSPASRDVKRDAKLLEKTVLEVVSGDTFTLADFERCEVLYRALYLEKYTTLNPHYTATFFHQMHSRGLIHLVGLRHPEDGLLGFAGMFESPGILTQPFVGYDMARPVEMGLYRMLMSIGRDYASRKNLDFNRSAGAARFKRNRGAIPATEYTAVYVDHLSRKNRMATSILAAATCSIGIPVVKRFET